MTLIETPMPMPIFAPVERVEAEIEVEDEVCERSGVTADSVGWIVLVFNRVLDEVGVMEDEKKEEEAKEAKEDEAEGDDDDDGIRREIRDLVFDCEECDVVLLSGKTVMVVKGFPALGI